MDIREYLETKREDLALLLCDLIRMPSVRGQEGQVNRYLKEWFKGMADEVELVEIPDSIQDDPDYSFRLDNFTYADTPNLLVRKTGTGGGKSLVFNTHVDVVPPSKNHEKPFNPRVKDGMVIGRGACDAKGQVAVLCLLVQALTDLDIQLPGDLEFHFVVEEECGGNGTLAFARRGCSADGAIVLEPTDTALLPSVRGAVWFTITCHGRAGHSGSAGTVVSALKEAIKVVGILERYHAKLLAESKGLPLFDKFENPMPLTIGMLEAGNWPASVPDKATLKGVLGFLPNKTREQVMAEVRAAIETQGGDWLRENYEIEFMYRHDGNVLPPDHPLVTTLQAACREVGARDEVSAMTASCDAWMYNNQLEIPTVVYGPGKLSDAHSNHEQIALDDIIKSIEVLIHFLKTWR
ncbi:MAG: ArgE/DapE family deacylase [Planctomycetota bacterium]